MKFKFATLCLVIFATFCARAQTSNVTSTILLSNRNAFITISNGLSTISFSNTFFNTVYTVEGQVGPRWVVLDNFFSTQRVGQVTIPLQTNGYRRFRLKVRDISPGNAFTGLAQSYGNIHTIAGKDHVPPGINAWQTNYEGAYATNVNLSNPRYAMADEAGNIYVVEQDSHAVLKISATDGRISTIIGGRHVAGDVLDFSRNSGLNSPNGLWVTSGRVYVLDTGNKRVLYEQGSVVLEFIRQQDMLVSLPTFTKGGGLWVAPDESEAFFASGTELMHYDKNTVGFTLEVEASGFREVGNIVVNAAGRTIVCDPLDNRVYRVRGSGEKVLIAGDGFKRNFPTGNERADRVSLPGARSVCYLTIGGYFVGLDEGARIWYVDSDDGAAPFVSGKPGAHAGDGKWFRTPGPKIGNVKSVTMTPHGDILIVEGSFIRKIDFKRHLP